MAGPCRSFVSEWPGTGIARWRDEAKRAGFRGSACADLLTTGCLPHAYVILIPCAAWASLPEAGAQCGSSARWDLCGGLPERAVPTATVKKDSNCHFQQEGWFFNVRIIPNVIPTNIHKGLWF